MGSAHYAAAPAESRRGSGREDKRLSITGGPERINRVDFYPAERRLCGSVEHLPDKTLAFITTTEQTIHERVHNMEMKRS